MRERGFSLVEALVAATILIVALGALAQLFAFSTRANQIARAITVRTMLARQKMEDLRLQRSPPIGGSLVDDVSGFHDSPRNGYVRRWSIETLAAGSASCVSRFGHVRAARGGASHRYQGGAGEMTREAGYSLPELLVAMAITATVMAGVF